LFFLKGNNRLRLLLALLVGNRAGSLAGRLAGGLALAAAALDSALFQVSLIERLDVLFHGITLPSFFGYFYYTKCFWILQPLILKKQGNPRGKSDEP
jgi:hypothetical protein